MTNQRRIQILDETEIVLGAIRRHRRNSKLRGRSLESLAMESLEHGVSRMVAEVTGLEDVIEEAA